MGRKVKIGLIQVNQVLEDRYEQRLDILESMARACYEEGAELVFFPEAYQHVPDRSVKSDHDRLVRLYTGWKARCAALAREYHAYIVPWDYEPRDDGRVYNSAYILDREGKEVGRYHKVNLTYGELTGGIVNGDDCPVFDLDFGRIGIMICFDNYCPEIARIMGNRGAELILYPLYGDTLNPQWELKMRARAVDSSVYVASCQIDNVTNVAYTGLVSPTGDVLCRLEGYPSHAVVEVDLGKKLYTNTMNQPGQRELIREYLKKCRHPSSFKGILEEPADTLPWEEIFEGTQWKG